MGIQQYSKFIASVVGGLVLLTHRFLGVDLSGTEDMWTALVVLMSHGGVEAAVVTATSSAVYQVENKQDRAYKPEEAAT